MTLLRHELKRSWLSLMIWTLSIGSFIVIAVLIYPEIKIMMQQMENFAEAINSMGSLSSGFHMESLNIGFTGYYALECSNTLTLGGAIFAALLGIGALAKEEKNGTAEFLLTHPLNRTEVVTGKLVSIAVQIAIQNIAFLFMAVISTVLIGEAIPWKELLLMHAAFFLLELVIAGGCFGFSAFLHRGGVGIGLGLAIAMYALNVIASMTSKAEALRYFTPFGFADGSDIISRGGIHTGQLLVCLGMGIFGIALAYWKYNQKDIR